MQRGEPGAPVVLADTQDNPGAGGNGDTTGLLAALIAQTRAGRGARPADRSGVGASRRTRSATGTRRRFRLGEISGVPGHVPLAGEFTVERWPTASFTCTGPMFKGFRMELGPMALLRSAGTVRVVLASKKCQAADQEMFRHLGVEPRDAAHPRAEELGAFPRRLRADRAGSAGGRGARPGARPTRRCSRGRGCARACA